METILVLIGPFIELLTWSESSELPMMEAIYVLKGIVGSRSFRVLPKSLWSNIFS